MINGDFVYTKINDGTSLIKFMYQQEQRHGLKKTT